MGDPHIVLELGHILFGRSLLGERPGQHELSFKCRFSSLHNAVQGRGHPGDGRMLDAALHTRDTTARISLVPGTVEFFGRSPELHDEVARQVFRISLTAFFAP